MYVEERMYTLKAGTVPEYLKHYQNEGMAVQLKHLPHMVGYYFTEVGTLNTIVHMWAYESLDERDRRRGAMSADPAWQSYLTKIRPLIERQETRMMKCAPFFVERLKNMLAAAK
jgi:NIPSNAP